MIEYCKSKILIYYKWLNFFFLVNKERKKQHSKKKKKKPSNPLGKETPSRFALRSSTSFIGGANTFTNLSCRLFSRRAGHLLGTPVACWPL